MDVDKIAFPSRLLEILEAFSACSFVSIDFEFSGVVSKPTTRTKQTLQERYAEVREAADKYQILQVGLTCATFSREKNAYVLKPYNIPICPTFDEELDLERQFSFQSGAVEFLLKNAFNFNVSFEDGVPYLSREEEEEAKRKFKERGTKGRFEDIEIADSDVLTNAFLQKVRGEVNEWLEKGNMMEGVEIMSRTEHWRDIQAREAGGDLTAFDKRLIHQIVRNEYPTLLTLGRRQSIIIKHLDEERELEIRRDRYKKLKKKIYVQTGFRWIIEAITRSPLNHIDLMWFTRDPETGQARYYEPYPYESRFARAADALKRKSPVLVGHNCFTDLIYLYSHFIGPLPATVEEFQQRIHDLFPTVVDTKYMFTHNCGNLNPMSSLDGIEEALRSQASPKIEVHKEHQKYVGEDMYHEAGYDSYLTARVMILLSAQLEAKGSYVADSVPGTPAVATPKSMSPQSPKSPVEASRFATKTMYEALMSDDATGTDDTTIVGSSFALNPNARPFPIAATEGTSQARGPGSEGKSKPNKHTQIKIDSVMPPFDSDFWRVYANKLRVFGTKEGLLDLVPQRK